MDVQKNLIVVGLQTVWKPVKIPSKARYTAIKEHDLKATEPAVGEGSGVNSFSQNVKSEMKEATGAARTPLRYALERGSLAPDIVELLVDKGADVRLRRSEEQRNISDVLCQ